MALEHPEGIGQVAAGVDKDQGLPEADMDLVTDIDLEQLAVGIGQGLPVVDIDLGEYTVTIDSKLKRQNY